MRAALKVQGLVVSTVVSPVAVERESRESCSLSASAHSTWRVDEFTRRLDLLQ